MHTYAIANPVTLPHPALPDADWADSFSITTSDTGITPEIATQKIMQSRPGWVARLMQIRDLAMRPFGLKPGVNDPENPNIIGIFPVIARADNSITLGLNDKHLDFRLVIEIDHVAGGRTAIRAITAVKRHNILGQAYLATITPFHRKIVPAMLNAAYGR
ncbi:DUF2867 domain-containing protein [Thalassospira lucentensis]|uniref:DUF2867 domain-containing protein n=1 Tax=Thalassospira lucentensis TaxID=168935 RepID=A0A358HRS6_9PROT|nr:DUF2867 domain-containing protein [Thalassospira lucentensis]HBU97860.1 DUF2867 domain-containing protein [Thalassospira lucentensis]HCW68292.1 DUF2867 domain-containing protein [Thalassospira lucentensis]|tara:strand:+ start:767 stop:1246 length:480 start_codon:yes stop_codon:yes gene_type:complete